MVFGLEENDRTAALLSRITLIEEDPGVVQEVKSILVDQGFQVSIARDGGQGQGTIRMHAPDLILMQVILSRESGFEICEHVESG